MITEASIGTRNRPESASGRANAGTKAGLFSPGEYASIPTGLLADPTIRPAAKVVYLGLASFLSGDKTEVWPGCDALRKRTGLSRRSIQQAIGKLIGGGWLSRTARGGPRGTNLYSLHPRRTKCDSAFCALANKMRHHWRTECA